MSNEALEDVRRLVIDDPLLRDRLLSAPDRQAFIMRVTEIARACDLTLSADDVEEALRSARRECNERWV
jgi:hypothetical protein